MSKQCLDISQMQHMKELGVDTRTASLCWVCLNSEPYLSFYDKEYPQEDTKVIPAFTLQDILDLLPKDICKEGCTWAASLYIDYENNRIAYGNTDRYGFEIYHERIIEETLIDAAYEMLCWCVENGYLETK